MSRPLFLVAAATLLAGFVPVAVALVRGPAIDALPALELGGTVATLVLACLAVGLHQSSFTGLTLVTAICTMASGLIFARFLRREP